MHRVDGDLKQTQSFSGWGIGKVGETFFSELCSTVLKTGSANIMLNQRLASTDGRIGSRVETTAKTHRPSISSSDQGAPSRCASPRIREATKSFAS
jgi:hypothetical protein